MTGNIYYFGITAEELFAWHMYRGLCHFGRAQKGTKTDITSASSE
jgi:hypothetical protein